MTRPIETKNGTLFAEKAFFEEARLLLEGEKAEPVTEALEDIDIDKPTDENIEAAKQEDEKVSASKKQQYIEAELKKYKVELIKYCFKKAGKGFEDIANASDINVLSGIINKNQSIKNLLIQTLKTIKSFSDSQLYDIQNILKDIKISNYISEIENNNDYTSPFNIINKLNDTTLLKIFENNKQILVLYAYICVGWFLYYKIDIRSFFNESACETAKTLAFKVIEELEKKRTELENPPAATTTPTTPESAPAVKEARIQLAEKYMSRAEQLLDLGDNQKECIIYNHRRGDRDLNENVVKALDDTLYDATTLPVTAFVKKMWRKATNAEEREIKDMVSAIKAWKDNDEFSEGPYWAAYFLLPRYYLKSISTYILSGDIKDKPQIPTHAAFLIAEEFFRDNYLKIETALQIRDFDYLHKVSNYLKKYTKEDSVNESRVMLAEKYLRKAEELLGLNEVNEDLKIGDKIHIFGEEGEIVSFDDLSPEKKETLSDDKDRIFILYKDGTVVTMPRKRSLKLYGGVVNTK
jgi:hypothetical protein